MVVNASQLELGTVQAACTLPLGPTLQLVP